MIIDTKCAFFFGQQTQPLSMIQGQGGAQWGEIISEHFNATFSRDFLQDIHNNQVNIKSRKFMAIFFNILWEKSNKYSKAQYFYSFKASYEASQMFCFRT